MAGLLIMTLAMMPIGLSSNLQQLFTLICVFYMGSIIAEPARETLGRRWRMPERAAAIWAFSRLGLAFGGAFRLRRRRLVV